MMRAAYKKSLDSFGSNESVCGHPDIYEAGGIMNNYQNQHDDMKNSVDYGRYDDQSGSDADDRTPQEIYSNLTEKQQRSLNRFVGCFFWIAVLPFLLTGIVFVIVGTSQYIVSSNKEKNCTFPVQAVVTFDDVTETDIYDKYGNVSGHTVSYSGPPRIKYTYNGREYIKDGKGYVSDNAKLDDEVEIYISPNDPEIICIPADMEKNKTDWRKFAIRGVIITLVCIIVPVARKIRFRKELSGHN